MRWTNHSKERSTSQKTFLSSGQIQITHNKWHNVRDSDRLQGDDKQNYATHDYRKVIKTTEFLKSKQKNRKFFSSIFSTIFNHFRYLLIFESGSSIRITLIRCMDSGAFGWMSPLNLKKKHKSSNQFFWNVTMHSILTIYSIRNITNHNHF